MNELDHVLELLTARASGRATNEQVEAAVQEVLAKSMPAGSSTTPLASVAPRNPTAATNTTTTTSTPIHVDQDTENYDNEETPAKAKAHAGTATKPKYNNNNNNNKSKKKWWDDPQHADLYADIPLGLSGARMIATFGGDAMTPPQPSTVRAVLQGARRMLQVAIQDARHVRRQRQKVYLDAQTLYKYKPRDHKATLQTLRDSMNQWSPELLFRVQEGHDPLSYKPKCGFDMEDLQHLFPEEMNAYTRWNSSYKEYDAQKVDEVAASATNSKKSAKQQDDSLDLAVAAAASNNNKDDDVNDDDNTSSPDHQDDDDDNGGHLIQRAEQFDLRTDQMKDDWYLDFSEARKGSFLPRKKKSEAMLPENPKASWANLPAVAIRFLHWIGFDPDSALPPPKEAVTHALAFLGYDFVGRIVEKAIELREDEQDEEQRRLPVLELRPNESLSVVDIERAMEDPHVKPVPLWSCTSTSTTTTTTTTTTAAASSNPAAKSKPSPQLYFGPGFEHRLEMELEVLMCGGGGGGGGGKNKKDKKKTAGDDAAGMSKEEQKIQQAETELFERLVEPPTAQDFAMLGQGGQEEEEEEDEGEDEDDKGKDASTKTPPPDSEARSARVRKRARRSS